EETFETGKKYIESIQYTPLVVKKECLGFAFNRIWHATKKEALNSWAKGYADIESIDSSWKIFTGMNLGLFELMDNIGLDVVYAVEMTYYKESGDERDKPPQALKDMIDRGELGAKTKKGFYSY
ncbi:MAG: 3-hydroxyacyl-CoA dehydrogenase family protein, partial [Promethearchaeota archaeon]